MKRSLLPVIFILILTGLGSCASEKYHNQHTINAMRNSETKQCHTYDDVRNIVKSHFRKG